MCCIPDDATDDVKVTHKGPLYAEGEPVNVILSFHPYSEVPGHIYRYGARKSIVKLAGGRLKEVGWDRIRKLPPPPAKEF